MSGLPLTYRDFVRRVRMSREPHILLEGSQDKRFFQTLHRNSYENREYVVAPKVAIVTAESIGSDGQGAGNREKVEIVAQLMSDTSFKDRFVGFVDREFREFSFSDVITDNLLKQNVIDRLIWSRGHSIENYMLDFDVVKESLYDFSQNGETAQKALSKLQRNFQSLLTIACAIGLAAAKLGYLKAARGTINWNIFRLNESTLQLDTERWRNTLSNHSSLNSQESLVLVNEFESCFDMSVSSGIDEVRWACDGHTGMRCIWAAYARLIFEISKSEDDGGPKAETQRDAVLSAPESVRFNHFARKWARANTSKSVDTPKTCFEMVGFTE